MKGLSIDNRLARLESIHEIQMLKYQYCLYCDLAYDAKGIASLFTEDGIWEFGPEDRSTGRKEIYARFEKMAEDIPFAAHLVFNPMIEVDGDKATGRWWLNMPCTRKIDGKLAGYWLVGEYQEEYRRIDGVWKISLLHLDMKYWTPHLEDWAQASVR